MELPDNLYANAAECLGIETEAAARRLYWAVVYGLAPFKDGDKWCVLLGEDIQSGICGFGNTPEKAISAFEVSMRRSSHD